MMHSLTKEEEASTVLLKGALRNVLGAHDPDAIPLYFSDDAVIQINERVLRGRDEITQRLTWIRDHTSAVQIDVVRIFFRGEEGFDHHTASFTDEQGKKIKMKVLGYTRVRDGKIVHYECLNVLLGSEDRNLAAVSISESV